MSRRAASARRVEELTQALEELRVAQEELMAARIEAESQQQRYHDLFEFAPDGYLVTGPRGRISEANRAAAQLLNIQSRFLLNKPLSVYIHREDRSALAAALNGMRTMDRREGTLRLTPRGSKTIIVRISALAVRRWGGELEGIRWSLRDVTEQQLASEALRASREDVRAMAAKLALAEEQERRRIATEIHDHISQSLAVAKLRLGMLRSSLSPEQLQGVDEVRELLSQVLAQSRSLTFELSPTVLYELGLAAAIEWLIEQRSSYGIEFKFVDETQELELRRDVSVTLFQAVRELLANVVKHSNARHATVRMSQLKDQVVIEVSDDGVGFHPPETLARKPDETSIGLFSVQERLHHLGGQTEIESAPSRGACIRLRAPIRRRKPKTTKHKRKNNHATERPHRR